jgi:hypothetical protein
MTLTVEQRAELEANGPVNIRTKRWQGPTNREETMGGFKCGDINCGDMDDWLAEKEVEERKRSSLQYWAMIILTAIAAIAACIAAWPVLKG